jgi:hypothetical protein
MWDVLARGPRNPSRLIFATTALIGATVGIATENWKWFFLAIIGAAAVQCVSYLLIRHWLGWRPLNVEYLGYLAHLLFP